MRLSSGPGTPVFRPRVISVARVCLSVGRGYLISPLTLVVIEHSVLLLEARDRIGGRTYTVNKDGALRPFWLNCRRTEY